MSKLIATAAIDGAIEWVAKAEAILDRAVREHDEGAAVDFPDTAYFLPVIHSFTGQQVRCLADCRQALRHAKGLLPERPSDNTWLPYLGNALDAGAAALFACEIIEACRTLVGPAPARGIWLGAASDIIMRERGIEFVDGTAPGFAAITGAAPSSEIAVRIARELQQKNLYVFMGGSTGGVQFAEQLASAGVQLGWETRLVPFGPDVSALIYALGFANRAALSFGGVGPGDHAANLRYNKDRIFAFVLALGPVDAAKYAVAAGAINYGFPVIADTDIPEILPTGVCTYEHVVASVPHASMVEKALEVRGCKVRITEVPVPVAYGPAFEGERIRKADARVEFGGQRSTAFEFVTSAGLDEINDGEIEIIGPDIDEVEPGTALPLAIWVQAAGRKLQADFEPILERQIHHLVNGAEGIWHMGQRDIVWTRISKQGFDGGLRLRHYGDILHAKLLSDYPAIVDKVKVTLITDADEVERRLSVARVVWEERNERMRSLNDESVDTFYSCLLCQSFAPDHVCVITPERLGLCGAYNWLDGKAAHEIDPTGPNQPVKKGRTLDPLRGVWEGVNAYVAQNSHGTIPAITMYSIMDRPMTSCGCFEVIVAYVPECNGVMVVNREFPGDTPVGMTFSSLAGSVGGGRQTPGFMGCGKGYISSPKFLSAEGGHPRLVWMPAELERLLGPRLRELAAEAGYPELLDKVATEQVATSPDEIRAHMERVGHPALSMPDMADFAESDEQPAPAAEAPMPTAAPSPTASEPTPAPSPESAEMTQEQLDQVKAELAQALQRALQQALPPELATQVASAFEQQLAAPTPVDAAPAAAAKAPAWQHSGPTAAERIASVRSVPIPSKPATQPLWEVTLGATRDQGGTRGHTITVGGASAMPFHLWEGRFPHRPVVALEVFDHISERFPHVLRDTWGELLGQPAAMAKAAVQRHSADLVAVRLDGTHPEGAGRSVQQGVDLVGAVLESVDVPLIITGPSHFDRANELCKAVAQAFEGERLLFSWTEQDNYRTIAGAALAYGHRVVAQSPIDVNIGKQMVILMTNMGLPKDQIILDMMTGAMGYGIEYTYSVMERARLAGLGGDTMLAGPMIVYPGQECIKVKEYHARQEAFPSWGELSSRAALWELTTATSLLHAGADILVMNHPRAAQKLQTTILRLMDGTA
jgi:acetyl-CoA synthase